MEFEYDPWKSEANEAKHGIGFDEARALWDDPCMVRFRIDYGGEPRWGVIARYASATWVAICTARGDRVRIISVRRASKREASLYDSENDDR